MLRHKPKFKYSGLTIIMSQPSRHDRTELLTGVAGYYFNNDCLLPETNQHCCDIRLIADDSPLLANTKCIMLLGEKAFKTYTHSPHTLDENRGSPIIVNGIPCIPSFSPQDAVDMRDFEKKHNAELAEVEENKIDSAEHDAGELFEAKSHGKTARENYRFWLKQDTKKALKIVANNRQLPLLYENPPEYSFHPSIDELYSLFTQTKDEFMFYDKETDFISLDMRCFAFSFSNAPHKVYVVPTLTTDYKPAYGYKQHLLWKALAKAVQNNILVAHNGSQFDYLVLAYKYRIPINRVYDTLVAQHRIFPTIEKSLGHCVSLCTYEPYHKGEGAHGYHNYDQALQLYKYCGKDVFTMYLVKKWQDEMAAKDEGLKNSIALAQAAIKPYLTASLLGMKYNEVARQKWIKENDRLMLHYLKIISCLTGPMVEPLISNQKCVRYFHTLLDYPVTGRTNSGAPSLSEKYLLKLGLKRNNPVIQFLIKYRQTQKETGTLNFVPWITEKVV